MSKIDTVYLVHHSHTDIGYTLDQPILWEMQTRFIDEALDLAEQYADSKTDGAFRWTVETTVILQRWLQGASDRDIERFIQLERAGRIEVTGMYANITPLLDTDELIESFQVLRTLREKYGFTIRHAMNCDVNGENWSLVDVLIDLGIEGFTMAINSHFGGAFQPRPYVFRWQGPSGRTISVNNGWPYDKGWREGIGRDAEDFANVRWPRIQKYLDEIGYPLPIVLLQSYHPYGDNGSAFNFTPFIDAWNASGRSPRIVFATPSMWWAAVKPHQDLLKTFRGDWTDFWNFGSISSAHEQAMNRTSRVRLRSADALYAILNALPASAKSSTPSGRQWARQSFERYRGQAWHNLILWDEHTWGADESIRRPSSEDTSVQWHHKANFAYAARSLSLLLQRDALGDFARHVERQHPDDILVFNPLPWERTVSGAVPHLVTSPRGINTDTTAGRQSQDRDSVGEWVLPPTRIPALGYSVISTDQLVKDSVDVPGSESRLVENHRYRLTFDQDKGGIISLYDKKLDWEWVDREAGYPLNGYVHETVADTTHELPRRLIFQQNWDVPLAEIPSGWQIGWHAKRRTPQAVLSHKVFHTATGVRIVQELEAPGCEGHLTQTVFLPNFADYIECDSAWQQGLTTHPEAMYILFPFNVPKATARFDIGGQPVIPGDEQLPGVCRDYFTAQGWVDFANPEYGVTVALPENPMVQLGDFHFGDYQSEFKLGRSMLLGWVSNNYWETNFRAHQPGRVSAHYRILPYSGGFNENRAHRFSLETANDKLVVQQLGEPAMQSTLLPSSASLLVLPEPPVLTLHMKTAPDNSGMVVRLLNASDEPQWAEIKSGVLNIVGASKCDLLEQLQGDLAAQNGTVVVEVPARQVVTVYLKTQ